MLKFFSKLAIGTVLLSVLLSLLLEPLLRDVITFIEKSVLTLSTLGVVVYKNAIYQEIARGFYEHVSMKILAFEFGISFGILIGIVIILARRIWKRRKDDSEEERPSEPSDRLPTKIMFFVLSVYMLIVFCISILDITKLVYVNRSIAYYNQLTRIVEPYIAPMDIKKLNSKFAQISSRENYVEILEELDSIINKNNLSAPEAPSFIF